MANSIKNKKTAPPQVKEVVPIMNAERKRQIRLGIGIFFLLAGIFTCFSIISYFFTWKTDQDHFFATYSLSHFLFHDLTPVANWGGRLGAAISHILVFKGAGIASLAIGMAVAGLGLNLIYEKRAMPLLRYMRWLSIVLLLLAPICTYLMPDNAFPLGGSLGKVSINYFNGFVGTAGTGMVLLSTLLFFVFVIFALDIRPFLNRMRKRAQKMAAALAPQPVFNEEETKERALETQQAHPATFPEDIAGNHISGDVDNIPLIIEDSSHGKEWDMTMVEKGASPSFIYNNTGTATLSAGAMQQPAAQEPEDDFEDEEYEDYKKYTAEKELKNAPLVVEQEDEDEPEEVIEAIPEFSFEVIQQEEKPAIKHGAHISIASAEPYAPELDLPDYRFPTLDLLEDRVAEAISLDKEELEKNKTQIIQTLRSFGIEIQRISATVGPTVTLYEIVPAEGVRISKIRNLEDDIALNLAALGIRIIAPIPGRGTIGIEVPNAQKQIVNMRTLISSEKFVNNKMSLPIALGKKIDNENYIVDLATMPHLLMAGATGQGKSVGINAILVSLLYKKHPSQLKFIMVDPKKVELSIYRTIEKHFLAKLPNEEEAIITDTKKVINTLNALCIEMDNRYELLKEAGARNIKEYNEKFISRRLNPEKGHKYLPFIVLVIDEFADLIMTAGKEVEMPIARLAQLARAIGIHLIIATQRPSVNVITGTIKANFPARIAFKVSAKVDSRTILDAGGAEQLIGRGDMLLSFGSELLRIQCAFVDTPEVEQVVDFIGTQRGYASAFELPEYEGEEGEGAKEIDLSNRDKLFEECARVVVQMQSGSTSNLQRRFNLGYNRAGRIMDQLEAASIVGPAVGSKPREVYFKTEAELDQFIHSLD
jgi:S-DNA-T family DNA segregation ATPase FtsK/SpoIIIE